MCYRLLRYCRIYRRLYVPRTHNLLSSGAYLRNQQRSTAFTRRYQHTYSAWNDRPESEVRGVLNHIGRKYGISQFHVPVAPDRAGLEEDWV